MNRLPTDIKDVSTAVLLMRIAEIDDELSMHTDPGVIASLGREKRQAEAEVALRLS